MRAAWASIVFTLGTLATFIACLLCLPLWPNGKGGRRIMHLWARLMLWGAGVKVRVAAEQPVGRGPYVVTPNHCSLLDIPASSAAQSLDALYVSRPFFFGIPVMGWSMLLCRHVALDPQKPKQAARVLKGLSTRFAQGASIVLFPEGTRSPDGSLQAYKRGPFLTAIRNGVPVLPMHLRGTAQCLPKGSLRPRPGEVTVTIGAAIPTAGLQETDARALAKRVENWARVVRD